MCIDVQIVRILVLREFKRVFQEPGRILGILCQPLLFWLILGFGFGDKVQLSAGQGKNYLEFFFPSMLTMNVLFTSLFASMSLIEDKKNGFLRAVYISAKNPFSIFLGKMLGLSLIVFFQTLILFCFAPIAGISLLSLNWSLVILSLLGGCVLLVSLNFCGAWILNSTAAYHGLMNLLLFPLWMISGTLFPVTQNSVWESVNQYNPFYYFGSGLRASMSESHIVLNLMNETSLQSILIGLFLGSTIVFFFAWFVLNLFKVELE